MQDMIGKTLPDLGFPVEKGNFAFIHDEHYPVMGVWDDEHYESSPFEMDPGDCLFVYTDGVTEAINEDRELYLVDTEPLAVNETDGGDAGGNSIPPAINFDMEDFGSAPTASPVAAEKDEHNAANAENVAAEKNEHTAAGNADDAADADDGMVSLESLMGEFGISDFGADFH